MMKWVVALGCFFFYFVFQNPVLFDKATKIIKIMTLKTWLGKKHFKKRSSAIKRLVCTPWSVAYIIM